MNGFKTQKYMEFLIFSMTLLLNPSATLKGVATGHSWGLCLQITGVLCSSLLRMQVKRRLAFQGGQMTEFFFLLVTWISESWKTPINVDMVNILTQVLLGESIQLWRTLS